MKRALILILMCGATAITVRPQQSAPAEGASPPPETPASPATPGTASSPAAPDTTTPAPAPPTADATTPSPAPASETPVAPPPDTQGAREMPLDAESFDVRVRRRIDEYGQRHQQRQRQMAEYDKATSSDPALERFADPRKVQVELSDELDREQTSQELASDYLERVHDVQGKEQVLQDFVSKRHQTLDDLGKQTGEARRQDLEVALANLARQPESPETLTEMREIDRRLSEAERSQKDLPAQTAQAQQEAAEAAQELAKLQTLEQSYTRESKTFTADALSAHQNRMRLASRLEYYVVRAQAEDELEQGRKALASVQHLSPGPEVESALNNSVAGSRSDPELQRLRACIQESNDVKGCRERIHQE